MKKRAYTVQLVAALLMLTTSGSIGVASARHRDASSTSHDSRGGPHHQTTTTTTVASTPAPTTTTTVPQTTTTTKPAPAPTPAPVPTTTTVPPPPPTPTPGPGPADPACTHTISAPASISSAASAAAAGDVLCLNGGTYTQAVNLGHSGTATAPITIESTPGQRAILDGSGLSLGSTSSIVNIGGSYIHLRSVELRNSSGRGVTVSGSHDVVANSAFHDMRFNGLIAAGSDNLVQGNEVYNTVTSNLNDAFGGGGWAEAMNTWQATNITFRNNNIHDNWGEGIDFIASSGGIADGNTLANNFSVLIYNDDSKNTTITNNHLSVTTSTYNRGSNRPIGIMMSEEGGTVGDDNIAITANTISGTLYGVAYWWAGSGALRSYSNVDILNNTISGTTSSAIHFDTVGSGSPAPFGNRLANNSISGSVSIGQPSAWTFS
jgi:parallel beta-helix repeat protein